jgi:hypothetical protein
LNYFEEFGGSLKLLKIVELFDEVYEESGMPVTLYTDDFKWKAHYSSLEVYSEELYYAMGMDEEQLTWFLGNHKRVFARQARRIREMQQIEYLNGRMAEIFSKSGFPQEFFDKMFED